MAAGKLKLLLLGGSASQQFTAAIGKQLRIRPGQTFTKHFSEGNTFVRVGENVRGRDVYFVQSLSYPVNDHFVELLFYIDALKRASARTVTAVIPFFGYGKGDKKDEPRVSIRARVVADCLEAAGVDRIVTMDLHAPQIQGFFHVPVDHLYALPVIAGYFRTMVDRNWVVVAPDVGATAMANGYSRALGAKTVIAEKSRSDHREKAVVNRIIGHVAGKNALIVDDFTTTGGTLAATAKRLIEEGAKSVYAAVAHGVMTHGAAAVIDASPIRQLIITDTLEYRFEPLSRKVKVVSAAPLFARAIRNIHTQSSVSKLFEF
ncbi:MAG: ribose-phosphate pyrophosphokinase [Phycisphaerae bacterium]|nr:MAG: ribose-phosphate diphosphokinase [Planctomycetia bacterium]RIK68176.1 MAG: ribose-phosphate pyrophosphokinase [Planctomycetota bacterium]GJQ27587.1 MAG: ribose-phosphate pyrophosphokinase [Phycisphaerae bacterium]